MGFKRQCRVNHFASLTQRGTVESGLNPWVMSMHSKDTHHEEGSPKSPVTSQELKVLSHTSKLYLLRSLIVPCHSIQSLSFQLIS